ncbi:LuxR C-terminal-related transcriptional regulator [Paenibacillus sinopodophylli]|uniref:LuxR C-terminal-related transcriptional regulator n=1 Tax=Paenibacillus sinopodophylli TaxID=1837342 RepID=UPI00110CC096|nr:LuxR C-terminal-related transcriptional regulator [Paenibacillus sinopodophylli]
MNIPILATKLNIPPQRLRLVARPRLIKKLNEGFHGKLTLISAPAGFGKTTLAAEWLSGCGQPAAWLSLDEGDNDAARFLTYVCKALQTIGVNFDDSLFKVLQSSQLPPIESVLTTLLNEAAALQYSFILVLDDYHVIRTQAIDDALLFLIEHMPRQMHVMMTTRDDPSFPLAKLRARGQLNELRLVDLRFTASEATRFLNEVMSLNLSTREIDRLEARTEGWIAGLQLAAISMQGHTDTSVFIHSFTGSHRFVLDYLIEEVLERQSANIQSFLLQTAILDRMCGSLCDAVLCLGSPASAQETLEDLERANLFIIPLDNERRWYRYHHLFADLLRQRLKDKLASTISGNSVSISELHSRASVWYEHNQLEQEAFHHAAAAGDVPRAAELMEGAGMPLHFRGESASMLAWLKSLPADIMDKIPSLWVLYASISLFAGQVTGIEQMLARAETVLHRVEPAERWKDLVGHIASIRATMAVSRHQAGTIIEQSLLALDNLYLDNLPVRAATTWALGYAYHLQGDRISAKAAYMDALTSSQTIGHFIITIMANLGIGNLQEAANQLDLAAQTYKHVLQLAGDPPLTIACEAHLGLARIMYEWNDLKAAEQHLLWSIKLAGQIENTDRVVASEVFLARIRLAQGAVIEAEAISANAMLCASKHQFDQQKVAAAAVQVAALLHQGNLTAADALVQTQYMPLSQVRVQLAQGNTSAAISLLERFGAEAEERGWQDEHLKLKVVESIARAAYGDRNKALQILENTLMLAQPAGMVRIFIDEGLGMKTLLSQAASKGIMPDYIGKLIAVYDGREVKSNTRLYPRADHSVAESLFESLSERELSVLQYIAQGLSNREISERLNLALSTVKGYNRVIFDKLQVARRTEAVARAREIGIL